VGVLSRDVGMLDLTFRFTNEDHPVFQLVAITYSQSHQGVEKVRGKHVLENGVFGLSRD
jgi:hypothetical protein